MASPSLADAVPADNWSRGADQVTVTCGYTRAGRIVRVTVNYALPFTVNPYATFDVGCTTKLGTALPNGDEAWSAKERRYRILSLGRWSYAGFYDLYHALRSADVRPFEAVARTLLGRSLPAAHDCTLAGNGGPTAPQRTWSFVVRTDVVRGDVELSGGIAGSFVAAAAATGAAGSTGDLAVDHDLVLTVGPADHTGPSTATVDVHLDRIVAFTATGAARTLRLAVTVAGSTYPGCDAGASGTLTASSAPSIVLDLCGGTLQGTPVGAAGTYVSIT